MKLFDALKKSHVSCAVRALSDGQGIDGTEPNIVLVDEKHKPPKPKAFRAVERVAWIRRPLKAAKMFDDWLPAANRIEPIY